MLSPFDPFWPFRWPLSGDVAQRFFSPALTVNYAGDAAVEGRVVADVASYGRQIGWLNELVLALVDKELPDSHTVANLKGAVAAIDNIKRWHGTSLLGGAVTALDRLQAAHPDQYWSLLDSRVQRWTHADSRSE